MEFIFLYFPHVIILLVGIWLAYLIVPRIARFFAERSARPRVLRLVVIVGTGLSSLYWLPLTIFAINVSVSESFRPGIAQHTTWVGDIGPYIFLPLTITTAAFIGIVIAACTPTHQGSDVS
jgi:hypothetical protein